MIYSAMLLAQGGVHPFTAATHYLSIVGYLRWLHYLATGVWY